VAQVAFAKSSLASDALVAPLVRFTGLALRLDASPAGP
jgi:hypothetical protein